MPGLIENIRALAGMNQANGVAAMLAGALSPAPVAPVAGAAGALMSSGSMLPAMTQVGQDDMSAVTPAPVPPPVAMPPAGPAAWKPEHTGLRGLMERAYHVNPETGTNFWDRLSRFGAQLQDIDDGGRRADLYDLRMDRRLARQASSQLSKSFAELNAPATRPAAGTPTPGGAVAEAFVPTRADRAAKLREQMLAAQARGVDVGPYMQLLASYEKQGTLNDFLATVPEADRPGAAMDPDGYLSDRRQRQRPDYFSGDNSRFKYDPTTNETTTLYTAPVKPEYRTVGSDLIELPSQPQALQPQAAAGGAWDEASIRNAVTKQIGEGYQVTSTRRTPEHNAKVGGAPNSHHLRGEAMDFVPPAGMSMADAYDRMKALGLPVKELLNEGDHIHIGGWNATRAQAAGQGGQAQPRVVYRGQKEPPSGYRWGPDGQSLQPIPGGPGENATRVNSMADVVGPILAKVSRGEALTPGETAAWDKYKEVGQDPFMRSLMGGDQGGADVAVAPARAAPATAPQSRRAQANAALKQRSAATRTATAVAPAAAPAAGGAAKPQPKRSVMRQNGLYYPQSAADMALIPSGSKFKNPADGRVYTKE